jgi:outer membrane protein insertion porin family
VQRVNLLTYGGSSAQQAIDWVTGNGHPYQEQLLNTFALGDGTTLTTVTQLFGTRFTSVEMNTGYSFNSLNRGLFADRGHRHSVGLSYTLPGSKVRSWVASYDYTGYYPLGGRWRLQLQSQVAYARALGGTGALAPYKRFYAGGPDTVRGFVESSMGPRDTFGNPYGGNLLTVARAEVIVPLPLKWQTSARITAFMDLGNVFSTDTTQYVGRDLTTPVEYKFKYDRLKRSAGVAVQWLAPSLGIFRFSYGVPLNKDNGDNVRFPDRTESFQFTVGQSF